MCCCFHDSSHAPPRNQHQWRRRKNHNWRKRSLRKPPEEQSDSCGRLFLKTIWTHVPQAHITYFKRQSAFFVSHLCLPCLPPKLPLVLVCMFSISLVSPRIKFCNQTGYSHFFSAAANWVFSARLLGSKPSTSYGQTFPAEELVIVVKTFPCNYNPMEPRNLGNSSK